MKECYRLRILNCKESVNEKYIRTRKGLILDITKFKSAQVLFALFFLITIEATSYGAGEFKEHHNKGIEFYKQGKYDQARSEFEKAIELKSNDVYAMYGLGNTYYCLAKYDDAIKAYSKTIEINPDYEKVYYSLSLAHSKIGNSQEAEKYKVLFKKLSRGEKVTGSSGTHATASSLAPYIVHND